MDLTLIKFRIGVNMDDMKLQDRVFIVNGIKVINIDEKELDDLILIYKDNTKVYWTELSSRGVYSLDHLKRIVDTRYPDIVTRVCLPIYSKGDAESNKSFYTDIINEYFSKLNVSVMDSELRAIKYAVDTLTNKTLYKCREIEGRLNARIPYLQLANYKK